MQTSEMIPVPDPPSDNPLQYCRLCFSPFRIEPVFTSGVPNQNLLKQLSLLIQIELNIDQDGSCAICSMCHLQLEEFQQFRERCRLLDQAVKKNRNLSLKSSTPVSVKEEPVEKEPPELVSYQQSHSRAATDKDKDDELWFAIERIDDEEAIENGTEQELVPGPATQLTSQKQEYDEEGLLNDAFWNALQNDIGVVPHHIINILNLMHYSRSASMCLLDEAKAERIANNMRLLVNAVQKKTENIELYYGEFSDTPENFVFLAGEIDIIVALGETVRRNGIEKYLKRALLSARTSGDMNLKQEATRLKNVIVQYYQSRTLSDPAFINFFGSIESLQVTVIMEDGGVVGKILCTPCLNGVRLGNPDQPIERVDRVLKVKQNQKGSWHFSNFISHCDEKHYKITKEGRKRKAPKNTNDIAASTLAGRAGVTNSAFPDFEEVYVKRQG